jgi:hypothetical protein
MVGRQVSRSLDGVLLEGEGRRRKIGYLMTVDTPFYFAMIIRNNEVYSDEVSSSAASHLEKPRLKGLSHLYIHAGYIQATLQTIFIEMLILKLQEMPCKDVMPAD